VAGKPIVQHLVEDLAGMIEGKPDTIVFVTGRFGEESENLLLKVAENLGATGKIAYQDEALGTAHAIWCAKEALQGPCIVAFADTLFKADFELDPAKDGVLFVRQIDDPSSFGVVKLNDDGNITDFVEKPETFVSDLAMIGIYYFKKGEDLAREIEYLIENDIRKGGEYQLPDALRRLTESGHKIGTGKVDEWMDCGNPAVTIHTNERVLALKYPDSEVHPDAQIKNSVIINPCFIGEGVVLSNSVVGPSVSIGSGTEISESRIERSIIQRGSTIDHGNIKDSMVGNEVKIRLEPQRLSAGDFTVIE
jgi:glucose-1-phosphate thymidylyltransferase